MREPRGVHAEYQVVVCVRDGRKVPEIKAREELEGRDDGRAFMGMTFGCARCHDHKFDPISIEDYYGLAGIFMSTKTLTKYSVVAELHHFDMSTQEAKERHKKMKERTRK